MNTCDIELINTCFHYFAIAVERGLASRLLDRLSAHPACRELATGLAGHSPPAFSPTFASNPPLDPTPEELATLAKLEELAPDYAPDFGPKPGGFCGVAGELVFCVYCGDEKLPLFKNAKKIFLIIMVLLSTQDFVVGLFRQVTFDTLLSTREIPPSILLVWQIAHRSGNT